jgi:hypothetical protein
MRNDPHNRRVSGKSCRSEAAAFAGARFTAIEAKLAVRRRRRLPLFAQFPPPALFAAIGRARARRVTTRPLASGTPLAIGQACRERGGR